MLNWSNTITQTLVPRTGLDPTKKRDDGKVELGYGLVDINNTETDKAVVLIVYENDSADSAQIIRIDV